MTRKVEPLPERRLGGDLAAVRLDEPLADGEAEAGAARALLERAELHELGEQLGQLLLGDAGAGVLDRDDDLARRPCARRISIEPLSVNLTAFEMMLVTTWRRRRSSARACGDGDSMSILISTPFCCTSGRCALATSPTSWPTSTSPSLSDTWPVAMAEMSRTSSMRSTRCVADVSTMRTSSFCSSVSVSAPGSSSVRAPPRMRSSGLRSSAETSVEELGARLIGGLRFFQRRLVLGEPGLQARAQAAERGGEIADLVVATAPPPGGRARAGCGRARRAWWRRGRDRARCRRR